MARPPQLNSRVRRPRSRWAIINEVQAKHEFHGLYEVGVEVDHFRPCAKQEGLAYPVQLAPATWPANVPYGAPGAFNSTVYFVRWRGTLDPVVRVPLGSPPAPRWFRVAEILEVRAPREGECGWSPPG